MCALDAGRCGATPRFIVLLENQISGLRIGLQIGPGNGFLNRAAAATAASENGRQGAERSCAAEQPTLRCFDARSGAGDFGGEARVVEFVLRSSAHHKIKVVANRHSNGKVEFLLFSGTDGCFEQIPATIQTIEVDKN